MIKNPVRSKMELIAWARRCLIEAMLAGISYDALAKAMRLNKDTLAQFATFGQRIDDAQLKVICDYFGDNDPVADRIAEVYDEYYAVRR